MKDFPPTESTQFPLASAPLAASSERTRPVVVTAADAGDDARTSKKAHKESSVDIRSGCWMAGFTPVANQSVCYAY